MMRLVVPIKQVGALDDEFELEPGAVAVDPEFLERDLNEWDTFSLEAAVQIKEQVNDAEVVVVSVGDDPVEEALVDALARGADRAVRVAGEDLSGDPLETARLLSAAIAREQADLVLCGVQSSDQASGAVGVALAALLDIRHVAVVRALELDANARRLQVDRELEGGTVEEVALDLPALVTVQTGANEPRYATLRAIKQASGKPLEIVTAEDLGLDTSTVVRARGARVTELSRPDTGEGAQMIEGDAETVAAEILSIVDERLGRRDGVAA